ncbi:DUF4194 domain-containing protein [Saccharothrix sp. HUAS TT1]|uniref:DUF4194 domain-containing protein n=1 Tax=unclassified Saccharothrix TaxID=2593673 RepID=UPI00345BAAA9
MSATDESLETGRSVATASLLRGVVYREENQRAWTAISNQRVRVMLLDYFAVLGLTLVVDETEQFAYLRSLEELPDGMPRLVRRHALTYHATVLLVLLRQYLAQADTEGDIARVLVTHAELVESLRVFHDSSHTDDRISADIRVVTELGYLRKMNNTDEQTYEVRRVVKAVITGDWLARFRDQLLGTSTSSESTGENTSGNSSGSGPVPSSNSATDEEVI